jgi:hypothetical protein
VAQPTWLCVPALATHLSPKCKPRKNLHAETNQPTERPKIFPGSPANKHFPKVNPPNREKASSHQRPNHPKNILSGATLPLISDEIPFSSLLKKVAFQVGDI